MSGSVDVVMETSHLREYVIRPTLEYLGLWSESAENLLLGTAAQESHMGKYLVQLGGPALGIYQIEPATHTDVYESYLKYKQELKNKVESLLTTALFKEQNLIFNLAYSSAICRVIYYRKPASLPDADDVEGLAQYWKKHYNTVLGAGTVGEFIANYNHYVLAR